MRILALAVFAALLQDPKPAPFLPLKEGATWTYVNGNAEGKVKVAGREKIGEVETFILVTEMSGSSSDKEFISVDATGIRMHRLVSEKTTIDYATPFVRLKLPPAAGDTWEWKGDIGKEKATATFKNEGEEEVTVPAGKFKAWKVTATVEIAGVKHVGSNWFAPGVGIVKQHSKFESGGKKHDSVIELKSFEPGA
ncbi:MAG TPA: hypothetical protein VJU16_02655 [Planctomycetota bacterium]|nr:hypothetical protein [Planctomycetota bacterium]